MILNKNDGKKLLSSLLCFTCTLALTAETFRVSKVHCVEISPSYSEATAKLGINESLSIQLPEDKTYIEGLELKMDIPESVAYWLDSVACSVYTNIKPYPTSEQIDYSGNRVYVSTLPGKLSWILQIPFTKENNLKTNQYTTKMDSIYDSSQNFVFVRLQPVMKGVPEETLRAIIPITIKPILVDKGKLDLSLTVQDGKIEPCTVFIDDKTIDFNETTKQILLSTGVHNVSIVSEHYRNEVRTVRIDQAKTTPLTVEMRSLEPTLLIIAPEGTKVYVDDEPCNKIGIEFPITEGEHKVRFHIGDYDITRTISVIKGKTYTANFTLDLNISED